ncbi:ABC transporter permease [Oceanobacillus bengalensis]|uniref:ABC transporter permease n=1 Tax=Oceanobacillus bengalensis TaxID=1435466 RepID=A0A494Z817_9BACI|nr:ABC transporter permease [Oceanobacillus bengalensis]RKQ18735.1 ABC transporter permease [Oceanobacillus bengalensis]
MLGQIIKKQALILLRNPVQLLLLIGLPMILIAILGTALGSWMNGDSIEINLKVALIEHETEEEQVARFVSDMDKARLPEEAVVAIKESAIETAPIRMLKDVFVSEELSEMIVLHEVNPSEKQDVLDDDSYAALIEVPENFTYETLNEIFLDEESSINLQVFQNEQQEIGANIVGQILQQFGEQLTLGVFLADQGIDQRAMQVDVDELDSEVTVVNQGNPVSSKAYYTIGMVVMNVLFMATAIGTISFNEKQTHVFDRIILANVSRWVYFTGVLITGMIFAFIQSMLVFAFAWIVFDITWPNLFSFFIVTLSLSISVGGIAVLLTAVSYRFHSEVLTDFFSSIIVTMMAFLGGSFFPIGDSSKILQVIGNLTPNGAGMSAYLSIIRGDAMVAISNHIVYILLFAITSIIIAVLSFPRRGVSA